MHYVGNQPLVQVPAKVRGIEVKAIGSEAFQDHPEWISVIELPEGVIEIQDNAFQGLVEAIMVKLPSSLKTIGKAAFYGYAGAISPLPDSLEDIGDQAFYFSPSLGYQDQQGDLYLPDKLKTIGAKAFYNNTGVWSVFLPPPCQLVYDHWSRSLQGQLS